MTGQLRVNARKNLSEKVTFELRPETWEGASYVSILGKSISGERKSLCRGLNCSQYGWGRGMTGRAVEDEARGIDGKAPEQGCCIVYINSKCNTKAF